MPSISLLLMVFIILGIASTVHSDSSESSEKKLAKATFAGGCFWCMEPPFDKLAGVVATTSGYTDGQEVNPTYEEVSSGKTGHAEAVQIIYDPSRTTFSELLDVFWKNIDPTQADGQFVDTGRHYRTAIFYHNEEQRRLAVESKEQLEKSGRFKKRIVTEIVPATSFYKAEEYHQGYYQKNDVRYYFYRSGSGRDQFIEKVWGKSKSQQTPVKRALEGPLKGS